jgi:2-dehydropantoate 2-reductase
MRTVFEVANASGVRLDPAEIDPAIERRAQILAAVRPSMLHDKERGLRLEVDALFGALERAAERADVDVPAHVHTLHRILKLNDDMARKRLPHVGVMR